MTDASARELAKWVSEYAQAVVSWVIFERDVEARLDAYAASVAQGGTGEAGEAFRVFQRWAARLGIEGGEEYATLRAALSRPRAEARQRTPGVAGEGERADG